MGKHTNTTAVNRAGLLRRYATLRGVSIPSAERMTRDWSRTELRECVERIEREERPVPGRRVRSLVGRVETVSAFTTMVDGVTR